MVPYVDVVRVSCRCVVCGSLSGEVTVDTSPLYRWLFEGGPVESALPDLSERDRGIVLGRFDAAGWGCEGCSCSTPDAMDSLGRYGL